MMRISKFYESCFLSFILFFIIIFSITSCAKKEVISELDFQKNLLAGSGSYQNTKRTWKIDSLSLNGAAYKLSTIQKRYTRTFSRDGSYTDSDGVIGTWDMPSTTELSLIYKIGLTSLPIKNKYTVVDISSIQLHLKYDSANFKQDIFFVLIN
jgi:hypothetical protein